MERSFTQEIKDFFLKPGSSLNLFIGINIAVYLFFMVLNIITFLFQSQAWDDQIIHFLAVPAALDSLLFRPWSLITYAFLHQGFFHLLFNMLWLFWFGQVFEEYLGAKKFAWVYLLGAFAGAILYITFFNIFPAFKDAVSGSYAIGASAGVMAIVVATATLLPDYTFSLLFIGPIRIKFIAAFYIILDMAGIASSNSGGHIAHLGGALFGFIFIKQLRNGNDFSAPFDRVFTKIKSLFNRSEKLKVSHKNTSINAKRNANQEKIDAILDKISATGYDSLSKEEKETLFKASK